MKSPCSFRELFFGPRREIGERHGVWDGWPLYTLLIVVILVVLRLLEPASPP